MRLQNFNDIEKRFYDINPKLRCHTSTKKTDGAIPYWNIATIDWLIVLVVFGWEKLNTAIANHVDTSLEKVILIQLIVDLTFS